MSQAKPTSGSSFSAGPGCSWEVGLYSNLGSCLHTDVSLFPRGDFCSSSPESKSQVQLEGTRSEPGFPESLKAYIGCHSLEEVTTFPHQLLLHQNQSLGNLPLSSQQSLRQRTY